MVSVFSLTLSQTSGTRIHLTHTLSLFSHSLTPLPPPTSLVPHLDLDNGIPQHAPCVLEVVLVEIGLQR